MKTAKFLFLTFLTLAVTSCGGDDDSGSSSNDFQIGTYTVNSFHRLSEVYNASDGSFFGSTELDFPTFTDSSWTFNDDGTFAQDGAASGTATRSVGGQTTTTESTITLSLAGTYVVNGSSIEVTYQDSDDNTVVENYAFTDAGNSIDLTSTLEESVTSGGNDYDVVVETDYNITKQ